MPEPRPTLADLAADPARVEHLNAKHAAAVLTEMAALQLAVAARLAVNGSPPAAEPGTPEKRSDRMLTLSELAERSRKRREWWLVNWRREIPSATKKGRTVLVRESDFEKWLRRS